MKISVRNLQSDVPLSVTRLRRVAREVAAHLVKARGLSLAEVSVAIVNDVESARVNGAFLRHRGPTDVITFSHALPPPFKNGSCRVGEIVISAPRARAQARQYHRPLAEELARYIVHGLLHLTGSDDATPAQRRTMRRAENVLLARLQSQRRRS